MAVMLTGVPVTGIFVSTTAVRKDMLGLLQMGIPGVVELFVVLLILGLFAVLALAIAAVVLYLLRRGSGGDEERIEELEAEVEQLRSELAAEDDAGTDDILRVVNDAVSSVGVSAMPIWPENRRFSSSRKSPISERPRKQHSRHGGRYSGLCAVL